MYIYINIFLSHPRPSPNGGHWCTVDVGRDAPVGKSPDQPDGPVFPSPVLTGGRQAEKRDQPSATLYKNNH